MTTCALTLMQQKRAAMNIRNDTFLFMFSGLVGLFLQKYKKKHHHVTQSGNLTFLHSLATDSENSAKRTKGCGNFCHLRWTYSLTPRLLRAFDSEKIRNDENVREFLNPELARFVVDPLTTGR